MPVAKISFSFQLSGSGDGLTLSFEMVIIVPASSSAHTNVLVHCNQRFADTEITLQKIYVRANVTVIQNGNDQDHEGREIEFPYQSNQQESKLHVRVLTVK